MPKYKLIASDLDGTLLKNDMTISKENLLAIEELSKKGVHFVLSTGRTLSEIPQELKDIQNIRYIIHSNGSVIYDKETKKRVTSCMSHDLFRYVIDTFCEYETLIEIRYNGISYVDAQFCNAEGFEYYHVSPYYQEFIETTNILKENFYEFCNLLDEMEVVSAYFRDEKHYEECKTRIESTGQLYMACPEPYMMEVFHKDAGKGKALSRLAKILDIAEEDTIAVGDSNNDRTIIKAAGLGLVVENGCQELKDIADAVICSNEEHIAEYVLTHYINTV